MDGIGDLLADGMAKEAYKLAILCHAYSELPAMIRGLMPPENYLAADQMHDINVSEKLQAASDLFEEAYMALIDDEGTEASQKLASALEATNSAVDSFDKLSYAKQPGVQIFTRLLSELQGNATKLKENVQRFYATGVEE